MKRLYVLGGGTISHVRNHLALCAPAFGDTARRLAGLCTERFDAMDVSLLLTKMADPLCLMGDQTKDLVTNEDIQECIEDLRGRTSTKVIFFNVALCDWEGEIATCLDSPEERVESGKYAERLKTSEGPKMMMLTPAEKIIKMIREDRKDIFVVGFKTTCGATEEDQYKAGLGLLKGSSVNLVLANDTRTRRNMIITPEEARYHVTKDRDEALWQLVDMTWHRSQLTFTKSTVVAGNPVPWGSDTVPEVLRRVVNWCIDQGAYKPFSGATVGHFAAKIGHNSFLTSIRKTDFNKIDQNGLVLIQTDGPDSVLAYGAKPSVGGQSQRIVFEQHPEYDCIVHFHCPLREDAEDDIPSVSQREYECGSHECGRNTSIGLKRFGNLSCVYLDNHGPNIVFNKSIDYQEVINFIDRNFDLSAKTGGLVD
jgi:hypothetical protein